MGSPSLDFKRKPFLESIRSISRKLAHWEITVANAAPRTPMGEIPSLPKPGLFQTTEQCGKKGCSSHRNKSSGNQHQIFCCRLTGLHIPGISSHDLIRKQGAYYHKHSGNACSQQQVCKETPADFASVFLPQILSNHNSGNSANGGNHHRINRCKFSCQAHTGHIDFTQLPDHDLIYHAKRRLQHGLQCYRNCQGAYCFEKMILCFYNTPPN